MSMDKLRAEIEAAIAAAQQSATREEHEVRKAQARFDIANARIIAYQDVLGTMDDLAEAEPPPSAASAGPGTGRAPRRDVMGAIRQAVRDYMEAKGLGPRLEDVVIGAGILLESDISESATRRALASLIEKGEMRVHDGRYATGGAMVSGITIGMLAGNEPFPDAAK